MDEPIEPKQDSLRNLSTARVMGKLFGKEKKPISSNAEEVSAFLHGPSDKLYMNTSSAPPRFPKLDTSNARRWPTAAEVNRSRDPSRRRSTSPKRSKKGLIVRFTDNQPEIIGEGGDEAESPTLEISKRKRAHSHPPIIQRATEINERLLVGLVTRSDTQRFQPVPTQRSQAAHEVISQERAGPPARKLTPSNGSCSNPAPSRVLLDIGPPFPNATPSRTQAEMRAAEGRALKLASHSSVAANSSANGPLNENKPNSSPLPIEIRTPPAPQAHTLLTSETLPAHTSETGKFVSNAGLQGSAIASGVVALEDFYSRLQHLYKLFRLSAESILPLSASSFDSLIRAASWWFLKGRASIENAIRIRPSSSESHRSHDLLQQQGHADVAKALWIMRDILSQRSELDNLDLDDLTEQVTASRTSGDEHRADMLERCQSLMSNLRMLSMSMQRNNCLPPPAEDAPLPQGLDTSIWISYPSPPPDFVDLLASGNNELITERSTPYRMKLSEAMPLGDTLRSFEYTRMFVDVIVMESGIQALPYCWPCIMFISRVQTAQDLMITISSQNGHVALGVRSDKTSRLTWNDVNWQSKINAIDIKLQRGLITRIQCSPNDFKTLWNMSDYTEKVHASIRPRKNEELVFDATMKTFQYFDHDPQSRVFPKEPIAGCHVRVLEKRLTDAAGNSAERKHRGFRIAVITGSKTKNLAGISHDIYPSRPIQYSLMRGDEGSPALLLKSYDVTRKPTMVFTFEDVSGRLQLFSCITGGARHDETVVARVAIKDFSIIRTSGEGSPTFQNSLSNLKWQGVQVINKRPLGGTDSDMNPITLSDSLRVIVDGKAGSITDRIYVKPGEMKIQLNPQFSSNEITILRQPQDDLSISMSESQISKEMPGEIAMIIGNIMKSHTIRRYSFCDIEDLHVFQAAVTGYQVLFDGLAESYAISRRRTVVSIHKRLETAFTRIQVLQHGKVMQIAAFFTDISHGECMNFIIKATDVFESFNRSSKFHVRLVDAKFAFPKVEEENPDNHDKCSICLDTPDYPGEHDDIIISFGSETVRDNFTKVLPTPVKIVSKLGSITR